jgi:hypothetical protein
VAELDLGALRRLKPQAITVLGRGDSVRFVLVPADDWPATLAALERIPKLERHAWQAADEIGGLRMALNDEMYAHEATRQRAERLEAALKARGHSSFCAAWNWLPCDCDLRVALAPQEEPS